MALTPAQKTALKNDITTQGLNSLPNNSDGAFAIRAFYEAIASPDFWVWRTSVSKEECVQQAGPEGTTFNWVGNGFITRSVGEQTAWRELFEGGSINASLANVRSAFSDIFSGTGNAAANRTHLLAVARRKANKGEKLLATGTGSTASPATMGFEGLFTLDEIIDARNS